MLLDVSTTGTLEKVSWDEVRGAVKQANPRLAEKIDALDLGKGFYLYKARYPFGCTILKRSTFYLPYQKQLFALHDQNLPKEVNEDLEYNSIIAGSVPLGVCLDHTAELYMQQEDRVIPFSFFTPGTIFGLWGALNNMNSYPAPRVWYITAGARSISVLPKITDTPRHKKLSKARGLKRSLPSSLTDHGYLLADMSRHAKFPSKPWYTEILFFPKNWLDTNNKGEAWARFHLFLHQEGWNGAEYWRNKVVYEYIWDKFVREFAKKNLKVSPHIVDIVEYLMAIGLGVLPGFQPATDNREGPIDGFQKDFIKEYGLRYFAPIIMVPAHFNPEKNDYVYWSMQLATYFESQPKPKAPNSIISDLREVINLVQHFQEAVLAGQIPEVIGTPFHDYLKKVRFDFFHSDPECGDDKIRHTSIMPQEDPRLIACAKEFGKRTFSEVSPFVRGCVRISYKKNNQ